MILYCMELIYFYEDDGKDIADIYDENIHSINWKDACLEESDTLIA